MGYDRLSRLVGLSCPVVAQRAKSEADSEGPKGKQKRDKITESICH